jgi:hypothetical protein
MPLTSKGKKIMAALKKQYGEDAESVFYAMKEKRKISGVEEIDKDTGKKKKASVKKGKK